MWRLYKKPRVLNSFAAPLLSTHSSSWLRRLLSSSTEMPTDSYVVSTRSRHQISCHIGRKDTLNSINARSFSVPLTVSDVHLRHEQLPFAFFFRETLDPALLKSSLKSLLFDFPVVGGRIDPELFQTIECNPSDSVPLSFGDITLSLKEWLSKSRNHKYEAGQGHPDLLPLFDPLFESKENSLYSELLKIRITYFSCGGTAIACNFLHALGDTASCVRFVQCWGREMQRLSYPRGACNDRSRVNTSGMMTLELADLMQIGASRNKQSESQLSTLFSWLNKFKSTIDIDPDNSKPSIPKRHKYVQLIFPKEVIVAMKEIGMSCCTDSEEGSRSLPQHGPFVSTNDLVTASGWLLKRALSGKHSWNISMVVNIRGRCGVKTFTEMDISLSESHEEDADEGLFGNGITNIVAKHPSTNMTFGVRDVTRAARSIRTALEAALLQLPDRLAQSRLGRPSQNSSTAESFPTTSWSQFGISDISFSSDSRCVGFHGHPSHPLPQGKPTYSSVVLKPPFDSSAGRNLEDATSEHSGYISYNLLLPSEKAVQAKELHSQLCDAFLKAQVQLKAG